MADGVEDVVELRKYIGIPESQNPITLLLQPAVTLIVVIVVRMLAAVQFDDETSVKANKVGDVVSDRNLAAKLKTVQLSVS